MQKNRIRYVCPNAHKCKYGCVVEMNDVKSNVPSSEWMPCVMLLKEKNPLSISGLMLFQRDDEENI